MTIADLLPFANLVADAPDPHDALGPGPYDENQNAEALRCAQGIRTARIRDFPVRFASILERYGSAKPLVAVDEDIRP